MMKILYDNGRKTKELEVTNFYKEVADELVKEDISNGSIEVNIQVPDIGEVIYRLSLRSGTMFIVELDNTLPKSFLQDSLKPCYLTCVIPEKNAYKFYKLTPNGDDVIAEYGRMGTAKGELFGARTFTYPIRMFWIKYVEKLSKGYVDRTDLYLTQEPTNVKADTKQEKKSNSIVSAMLYQKLKSFAKSAVREARVSVPITRQIIQESKRILNCMYHPESLEQFNDYVLELIAILQRPVRTGDGTGVKRMLASSENDYARIIERESDLIQAMEGMNSGNREVANTESFDDYNIEIYSATEKQKKHVLSHLSDSLKGKVKNVYRIIPTKQQRRFDAYLKEHDIKTVKQLWHGSRNQNWLSIMINSLQLNPNAIITGKMFGQGICAKRSTITCIL